MHRSRTSSRSQLRRAGPSGLPSLLRAAGRARQGRPAAGRHRLAAGSAQLDRSIARRSFSLAIALDPRSAGAGTSADSRSHAPAGDRLDRDERNSPPALRHRGPLRRHQQHQFELGRHDGATSAPPRQRRLDVGAGHRGVGRDTADRRSGRARRVFRPCPTTSTSGAASSTSPTSSAGIDGLVTPRTAAPSWPPTGACSPSTDSR